MICSCHSRANSFQESTKVTVRSVNKGILNLYSNLNPSKFFHPSSRIAIVWYLPTTLHCITTGCHEKIWTGSEVVATYLTIEWYMKVEIANFCRKTLVAICNNCLILANFKIDQTLLAARIGLKSDLGKSI